MRYAVFSDVHSNRQAWEATLADIRHVGADVLLCLGDVIGYGPAPGAVLESVYEHCSNFVLGNHDAVVAGRFDSRYFNASARAVIEWTREQLNSEAVEFFAELPLRMAAQDLLFVHANAVTPGRYNYVETPANAWESLHAVEHRIVFVGHSHIPAVYAYDPEGHAIAQMPLADSPIEDAKRYLVNVGSVGEPRDGTPQASYCLFDSREGHLSFRRVEFDIEAFRKELAASGLTRRPFFLQSLESAEARLEEEALEAERLDGVKLKDDLSAAQATAITMRPRKRKRLQFTADAVALQRVAAQRRAQFAAHARRRPEGRFVVLTRIAAAIVLTAAVGGTVAMWALLQRPVAPRIRQTARKPGSTSVKAPPTGQEPLQGQNASAPQNAPQTQTPPRPQTSIAPAPGTRPMPDLDSERGRAVLAAMEAAFNKGVAQAEEFKAQPEQPPTARASGKQTTQGLTPGQVVRSRLDIHAADSVTELAAVSFPKGGYLRNVTWGETAARKAGLTGETPSLPSGGRARWETFSFAFIAAKDCEVKLAFKGNWNKAGELADGKPLLDKAWTHVADVRAEGAGLVNGDFANLKDGKPIGWWLSAEAEMGTTEAGDNAVTVWHNAPVIQTISVRADTPVTITYLTKYADFEPVAK